MENAIRLDWASVERLLPLLIEFKEQIDRGESVDLKDAAMKAGQAFGIEDIDAFAKDALSEELESGFGEVFADEHAKELAAIFAGACQPVMKLVFEYAQGGGDPAQLFDGLNRICSGNVESLQSVLQQSLGIPDGAADAISGKLGPYTVSVYCFAAALKIYQKAADDAQLAKERRIEIERLSAEAAARLNHEHREMESLVDGYLLDRLAPFAAGVAAMDEAVLACDDDGFIAANSQLWDLFGRKAQYETAAEFDELILSDETFRL